MTLSKILIANRGEIACRIIKTANRLGVKCVSVFSDSDRNSLHVKLADEAIYIGKSQAQQSYLVKEKIIDAAKNTQCQAVIRKKGRGLICKKYYNKFDNYDFKRSILVMVFCLSPMNSVKCVKQMI